MTDEKPVTFGGIKGAWPFILLLVGLGVNLFVGGMTWATTNSKLDNVILAQKETNEVAKTLTKTVNDHETRVTVIEKSACYSACFPRTSQAPAQTQFADSAQKPTQVNVKSESNSSSSPQVSNQESPEESKDNDLVKVNIPQLSQVAIPRF